MLSSLTLVLASILGDGATAAPKWHVEVKESQRVQATLNYRVHCEKLQAKEWIVFAGHPPELWGQTKMTTRLGRQGQPVKELSDWQRIVEMERVLASTAALHQELPVVVVYEGTLRSRHLKPLEPGQKPPQVGTLADPVLAHCLASSSDFDYDSAAAKKWIADHKLHRHKGESEIDYARRVFRQIKANFTYVYRPDLDRHASAVCQAGHSDCGGLSALFVATMRASGIPSRALYGRWARSSKPGAKLNETPYYQWHVKSEFFAQGVGWVPVDLSSGILHDKTQEGLAYFGHDRGDFITMHVDADLVLDTDKFGEKRAHSLQTPMFWVTGSGPVEPKKVTQEWQVKTFP